VALLASPESGWVAGQYVEPSGGLGLVMPGFGRTDRGGAGSISNGGSGNALQAAGNSGLRVSELCLGTMTFGEDWGWGSSKEESRRVLDAFLEAGGNFIDTANVYTNGTSETLLGEFLKGDRDRAVLATKYTNSMPGNDPNAGGNQRKNMVRSVGASLKRLQTDYIDLYWLHIWDRVTPPEEVMRAFDDLVRQGKILHAGVSDMAAWAVARANTLAELRGWTPFVGLQIEYSLVERTVERELLPMAKELGLGVTAWSPLAGGVLTAKYAEGKAAADSRMNSEMMKGYGRADERTKAVVAEVRAVASEVGRSPAQVALAWLRQRPVPVIPIVGARRLEQFKDNLACLDLKLDGSQLQRLDAASHVELGFPYDLYERDLVKGLVYGGMRDRIDV
jgi:aryl-alcohol dehydrogenase-like predicted oxidoreductase